MDIQKNFVKIDLYKLYIQGFIWAIIREKKTCNGWEGYVVFYSSKGFQMLNLTIVDTGIGYVELKMKGDF